MIGFLIEIYATIRNSPDRVDLLAPFDSIEAQIHCLQHSFDQLSQSENEDHADLVRPLSEGTIGVSRTAWTTLRLTWLTWNLTSMNPFTTYRLKAKLQRSTSPPYSDARMITSCIYFLDKFCSWWAIDLTRPYFVKFFSVLFCLYLKGQQIRSK